MGPQLRIYAVVQVYSPSIAPFFHNSVFCDFSTSLFSASTFHPFLPFYSFPFPVISNNANDTQVAPVASSWTVKVTSLDANTGAAGKTPVVNCEIDRRVLSWLVVENQMRYADTLDAKCFCKIFLNGANAFTFDCSNVLGVTDDGKQRLL